MNKTNDRLSFETSPQTRSNRFIRFTDSTLYTTYNTSIIIHAVFELTNTKYFTYINAANKCFSWLIHIYKIGPQDYKYICKKIKTYISTARDTIKLYVDSFKVFECNISFILYT